MTVKVSMMWVDQIKVISAGGPMCKVSTHDGESEVGGNWKLGNFLWYTGKLSQRS